MPAVFLAASGSKSAKANDDALVFIGSARRHFRLDDSIKAALWDAARKVAFFHSVSGEIVTHESSGALVGSTFATHTEIKDPGDYTRYLDKLEYDREKDVLESDAVFVRTRYRGSSKINIDYRVNRSVQNNVRPQWINNPPAKIGPYSAIVGFSAPRVYHNDTVVASYENAILGLIESFSKSVSLIESEARTTGSNNAASLSISAGTLTGFFVVDTWTEPRSKAVWTLAIADGFTKGEIAQSAPPQFIPAPAPLILPDWQTNLPRETETTVFFWGFSGRSKDRREAETRALQDAKLRISGYILEIVEGSYAETSQYKNDRGRITEDVETINEFSQSYTQSMLEGVKPIVSHPTRNADGSMEVQILVSVLKADIIRKREEIDQRMKDLSAHYTAEIRRQTQPGLETLRKYQQIVARLNPLERSLVNFLGSARPVNLHTYLIEEIRKLSDRVYVARVEFQGNFSNSERNNIYNALQNGLRNSDVKLQLVNTGNTDFRIIVAGEDDPNAFGTIRWKMPGLSLQFMQGGTLKESAHVVVPVQVDRAWLITETVNRISQERSFFLKIKDFFTKG
jgi:hypothetical protein